MLPIDTALHNKFLKSLSYYNLIGGIVGLIILASNLPELGQSSLKIGGGIYATIFFMLSIASFGIYQKRQDPTLMGVVAIMQLPAIEYEGLKYVLSNGMLAIFGLASQGKVSLTLDALYEVKFKF
ncbi:hypothetical protein [Solirubrum puertoriconensis]|uniref:Uncharacterized protein n=1 Tax=Solirubrum puertoriconensis TaxID=1751427 RepID=A0A9X0HK70_SOLP1|nr:hypothetical protein [Solirubrum puertoriconensis]KUG07367.1 hypothetical protein ASU33_13495 [Solirubrum puertoriconensis]